MIGCILLAAGSGRRFGGDKLTASVDGVPLIEHALRLHAAVDYAARVLVTRPGDAAVQACARRYGFPVAENAQHLNGIGTSVHAGISALMQGGGALDGVLCAVCDQPYLTYDTVQRLVDAFAAAPTRIVAPCCGGRRGNPVLFPWGLAPELAALNGDVGGSAVIARRQELLHCVSIKDARELFDIDYRIEG